VPEDAVDLAAFPAPARGPRGHVHNKEADMRFGIGMALAWCALALATAGGVQAQSSASRNDGQAGSKGVASATVNLNTASASQLESLPGIGPRTAERIVEYRQKNGNFKKIEELMNVQGIGEKSFLRIKDRITVAPAAR
jgi:comEA protein